MLKRLIIVFCTVSWTLVDCPIIFWNRGMFQILIYEYFFVPKNIPKIKNIFWPLSYKETVYSLEPTGFFEWDNIHLTHTVHLLEA